MSLKSIINNITLINIYMCEQKCLNYIIRMLFIYS